MLRNMLQALKSRIAQRNLVVVDEIFFMGATCFQNKILDRVLLLVVTMSVCKHHEDFILRKNFLFFFAVTLTGVHYYKVCNEKISSENYIQFIKEMANHSKTTQDLMQPEKL